MTTSPFINSITPKSDQVMLLISGTFELTVGQESLINFGTDKAQALLAYLAVEAAHPQRRETLAALLWPDVSHSSALGNLRGTLYRLRSALNKHTPELGKRLVISTQRTLQINRELISVDLLILQELIRESDSHNHAAFELCDECLANLDSATALYRGEMMPGFGLHDAPFFEEWLRQQRETFQQTMVLTLQTLSIAYTAQAKYEKAQHHIRHLLTIDPYHEDAHYQMISILASMGQRSAALQQYETYRHALYEDLEIEPSQTVRVLYEQILTGEFNNSEVGGRQQQEFDMALMSSSTNDAMTVSMNVSVNEHSPESVSDITTVTAAGTDEHSSSSKLYLPATNGNVYPSWHEIPVVDVFYGRMVEIERLTEWLLVERCRLMNVLGMGGVGKTALAAIVAQDVGTKFDVVIWRSLLNRPLFQDLVEDWLDILASDESFAPSSNLDQQISLLLNCLSQRRCLLVLDNVESILHASDAGTLLSGRFQAGYETYGQLLLQVGNNDHNSCLLLTSREQPYVMNRMRGVNAGVYNLYLSGLDQEAAIKMLAACGLTTARPEAINLTQHYSANPMALQIVASTIVDLFGGDVDTFLQEDTLIFDDIRMVLDELFQRLTSEERRILFEFTVEQIPISIARLRVNLAGGLAPNLLIEAVRSLQRRSLLFTIEKEGDSQGRTSVEFTLQNVVMKYVTNYCISQVCNEIVTETPQILEQVILMKMDGEEEQRTRQLRFIIEPICRQLVDILGEDALLSKLEDFIQKLQEREHSTQKSTISNLTILIDYLVEKG